MQAKLIVIGGKADNRAIGLKLPTVIGRSKRVDLTVAHPMISRQHCELFEVDGLLIIRDLGSLNGTVVGGRRIEETPLPPDEKFTVGPITFRAEYEYNGDLEAALATNRVESEQPRSSPVFFDSHAIDEVTPFHPQTTDEASDESKGESSAWSHPDPEADETGSLPAMAGSEFDGVGEEEEDEEEEPQPTPPPPNPTAAKQPASESTISDPTVEKPAGAESDDALNDFLDGL